MASLEPMLAVLLPARPQIARQLGLSERILIFPLPPFLINRDPSSADDFCVWAPRKLLLGQEILRLLITHH